MILVVVAKFKLRNASLKFKLADHYGVTAIDHHTSKSSFSSLKSLRKHLLYYYTPCIRSIARYISPKRNHQSEFSAMLFLRIIAALTSSSSSIAFLLLFSAATTASNSSTSDDDLPFGFGATPFIQLNLQRSNHSNEQYCVTLNNRELCTVIDYCPLETYQCANGFDPNDENSTGTDYSCGFTPSQWCNCSATWGGHPCSCYVTPNYPYIVGISFECFVEQDQPTTLLLAGETSYFPGDKEATSGILTCEFGLERLSPHYFKTYFELQWQCPDGGAEFASTQRAECTCRALYGYEECSACEVCGVDDASEWSWTCPGYSADCNNNYTVWVVESSAAAGTSGSYLLASVTILWMVTIFCGYCRYPARLCDYCLSACL
jgi:hypothetical protein